MQHGVVRAVEGKCQYPKSEDGRSVQEKQVQYGFQPSVEKDCETGGRKNVQEPLDRGYAWVIMICSAIVEILCRGIQKSVGMFFFDLKEELNADFTQISLIAGLFNGIGHIIAPFGSVLVNRFSCKFVAILGGLMMSIGLGWSSFSTDIIQMTISFGLVIGMGIGFVEIGSSVIIGRYFKTRLSAANGVRMAGASVASIIYPYLVIFLLQMFFIRGTILILASITLNIVMLSMLYRSFPKKNPILNESKVSSIPLTEKGKDNLAFLKDNSCIANHIIYASPDILTTHAVQTRSYRRINSVKYDDTIIIACEPHRSSLADRLNESGFSLDFTLLYNPVFVLISLAFITVTIQIDVFLVILPAHGEALGFDKENAAQLMIIFSITDLIFRLLSGWVIGFFNISQKHCYIVCNLVLGVGTCFCSFYKSYEALVAYSAIYGIFWGFHTTLSIPIYVESFGIDKLASALAFYKPLAGIGTILTQTFLGNLMENTNPEKGFDDVFYVIAGLALATAFFLSLTPIAELYLKRKNTKRTETKQLIVN